MKSLCIYAFTIAFGVYNAAAQCEVGNLVESDLQTFIVTRVNAYRAAYSLTSVFAGGISDLYQAATVKCENVPSTAIDGCTDPLPYQWSYTNGTTTVECCASTATTDCANGYLTNIGSSVTGVSGVTVLLAGNTTTAISASNIEMYTDALLNHSNGDKLVVATPPGGLSGYGVGVSTQAGKDNKYYVSFFLAESTPSGGGGACTAFAGTPIASSSPVATSTSTASTTTSSDASQTAVASAAVLGAAVVASVRY